MLVPFLCAHAILPPRSPYTHIHARVHTRNYAHTRTLSVLQLITQAEQLAASDALADIKSMANSLLCCGWDLYGNS